MWIKGSDSDKSRLIMAGRNSRRMSRDGRKQMRQKTSDATYFLFLSTRLSLAAEEFKENWERHWHAILTMTCCFTQTLLMLCVAFAALHTHTHKVTHKALLIQPNTASLICSLRKQSTHCLLLTQTLFHQGFFSLRNSTGLSAV